MIAHAHLEKYAHLVEDEDEHGAFEEWAPRKGLDLQLAVAVCTWCAHHNAGGCRAPEWFWECFEKAMIEAGYEYIAYRGQSLFAPIPVQPFDPGWVAVH
jgi:hypothetical protein